MRTAGEHGAEVGREAGLSEAKVTALLDSTLITPEGAGADAASPTPERTAVAVAFAK